MKGIVVTLIIVGVLLVGALGYIYFGSPQYSQQNQNNPSNNNPSTTTPGNHNIDIRDFAFSPSTLTIKAGDTVTWMNKDSATHTITSDSGNELSSGNLAKEQSYSHTFTQKGTYAYHCSIHTGMVGTITVE